MLPLVGALLLAAQVSSSAPAPTPTDTPGPPTPVPTATPVGAANPNRPRSLSELAKERRLGRLTGSGAAVVTTPEPEPAPAGTPAEPPILSASARRSALLRVEDVQDNGAVADGRVSIYGKIRNTGRTPLCRVRIFLRMYDDHGVLL